MLCEKITTDKQLDWHRDTKARIKVESYDDLTICFGLRDVIRRMKDFLFSQISHFAPSLYQPMFSSLCVVFKYKNKKIAITRSRKSRVIDKKEFVLFSLSTSHLSRHGVEEQQAEFQAARNFEAAMTPQAMNSDAHREIANCHDQHPYKVMELKREIFPPMHTSLARLFAFQL